MKKFALIGKGKFAGLLLAAAFITAMFPAFGNAQPGSASDDMVVDEAWKSDVIDSVLLTLDSNYVFPDMAQKMNKHIRKLHKDKAYKDITDARVDKMIPYLLLYLLF